MALSIQRLHCVQLPEVAIIGVDSVPPIYLAHAQQVIKCLLQTQSRHIASASLSSFLKTEAGKKITKGGDVKTASLIGPLKEMLYTYKLGLNGGGSPSHFLTVDGVRHLLQELPNQDDSARERFRSIFEDCVQQTSFFLPATIEQCSNDNECDYGIENIFTSGCGPSGGNEQNVVTEKVWYETQLTCYQSFADGRILAARLVAKDAEIAKERAEKERFQERADNAAELAKMQQKLVSIEESRAKDLQFMRESHAKDLEIMRLKMQLEFEQQKKTALTTCADDHTGAKPNRKRAQTPGLETEDEEEEEVAPPPQSTSRTNKLKIPGSGLGGAQLYWLVVYEGDVELTFDKLEPRLSLLSKIDTTRFDNKWFTLLVVKKRIRITPIARAVRGMELSGSIWVEAFSGCTTWVGMDIPSGNVQTPSSTRIVAYMAKKQWNRDGAAPRFPMVLVK